MGSGVPAYRQVIDQILGGIAFGALSPGEQLPTVRQLAFDLAINPNTLLSGFITRPYSGIAARTEGSE